MTTVVIHDIEPVNIILPVVESEVEEEGFDYSLDLVLS